MMHVLGNLLDASDTQTVKEIKKLNTPLPPALMNIVCSFFHYSPKPKAEEVKKQPAPSPDKQNEQEKGSRCAIS